jgi:hypothetical protein
MQKPNRISVLQAPQTTSRQFVIQGSWSSTLEDVAWLKWLNQALSDTLVSHWIPARSAELLTRPICRQVWAFFGEVHSDLQRR